MTWANWTSYATTALNWVLSIFTSLLDTIMGNPLTGVPLLLGIIFIVFKLAAVFIGTIGTGKNDKED